VLVVRDSVLVVPHNSEPILPAAIAVRRGVTSLGRRLRSERTHGGLTSLEVSVLVHLSRRGLLTPGDLALADHVQPQSLTRTLTSLAARGLLTRQPDPGDGRRSLLGLTESGRAALRAEMERRDSWLSAAIAEHLTATEAELLRLAGELMERLADAPAAAGP
jgi:DNA-binding MarR family transcriptional regulator